MVRATVEGSTVVGAALLEAATEVAAEATVAESTRSIQLNAAKSQRQTGPTLPLAQLRLTSVLLVFSLLSFPPRVVRIWVRREFRSIVRAFFWSKWLIGQGRRISWILGSRTSKSHDVSAARLGDAARASRFPYGEKTRPGQCPEQQLFARPPSMINQAREVLCQGRFPASLIYVLIVSPSHAVPSTFHAASLS